MFQPFALIPLANLLKVRKYAVNDLIVEQGKPLKFFYIVSKGRLKVLRIEKTERSIKKDLKPKHMIFSIMDYKQDENDKKNKQKNQPKLQDIEQKPIYYDDNTSNYDADDQDNQEVERILRNPKLADAEKIFDFQIQKRNKETVYYKKFVEYDSMSQGDFFGGRVLTDINPANNESGVALKTVIADTNEVEVYVLEKNQLQFLPQFIKEWLLIGLQQSSEYDDINKKIESEKNKNWEKLKEQMHQSTVRQIKLDKRSEKAKIW